MTPGKRPPQQAERVTRRTVQLGVASTTTVALAGCSGDDTENGTETTPGSGTDEPPASNGDDTGTPSTEDDTGTPSNEDETGTASNDDETASEGEAEQVVTFEHPDRVFVDEPFGMTIGGLAPNEQVDVRWGEPDRVATTTATVETGPERTIDLADATVVGGDVPADLDVPLSVALLQFTEDRRSLYRKSGADSITYAVDVDGEEVGRTELTRVYPPGSPDRRLEDDHETLVGPVFEPVGADRGPGVVVLHGSDGTPSSGVAAQLALRGHTAVALHYFDGPGLPENLVEVPLEYVREAIDWLRGYSTTAGEAVGLMGYSKGGELALLAGSQFDGVGAVVSVAGSGLVWAGVDGTGAPEYSSWSLDGEPVPYVPYARSGWSDSFLKGYRNSFREATEAELDAAAIPAEEIDGPVLLVSGGDDQLWDAELFHGVASDRLMAADRSDFAHLVYDDAGHGIAPPYYPVRATLDSPFGPLGGTLVGNAEASHDHWPQVLETLSTLD